MARGWPFSTNVSIGAFKIPEAARGDARYVEVDDVTLEALLDGIDIEQAAEARSRPKTH